MDDGRNAALRQYRGGAGLHAAWSHHRRADDRGDRGGTGMSVSRRAFLAALPAAVVLPRVLRAQTDGPTVDAADLRTRIEALSVFGRPADGGFEGGVSRVAYSDADVAGRRYVMDLMRGAGLTPRIDPAGNIFAL